MEAWLTLGAWAWPERYLRLGPRFRRPYLDFQQVAALIVAGRYAAEYAAPAARVAGAASHTVEV